MTDLVVLVLASGLSARMAGANKLLMPWRGRPLVRHVLALAEGIECPRKVLVTYRDSDLVVGHLSNPADWTCVVNDDAADGLASSLRLGLAQLEDATHVLVMLGDMPDVRPSTLEGLIAALTVDAYAIVPVFEGQWGNPVILGPQAIADCGALQGDQGARRLLLANEDRVVCVHVDDPAILSDFDVPADFDAK